MTLERKELNDGTAWQWISYTGLDDTRVTHQLQWSDERQRWLHWQKVNAGGWTERDVAELPAPEDDDHAEKIVRSLMGTLKRG